MAYTDHTRPAPRVDLDKSADVMLVVADITSGNVDLTTVAGAGKHGAQVVRFNNATAAALSAVIVPEQKKASNGSAGTTSFTIVINAGQQYEPPIPIKAIIASGSGALSAVAFWWNGNSLDINK